nr:MAG TPA: Dynactin subunit 1, CAP-Gly domain-containing PROTEIN MICROTUBULE BINDING, DYNACTIN.6A [Caudoviricetes sp.]
MLNRKKHPKNRPFCETCQQVTLEYFKVKELIFLWQH